MRDDFFAWLWKEAISADVQSFDTTDLVLQDSVWNCGPATLVNLFKLYGLDVSQDEIVSIAGTDSNGTSLYGLYLACVHYGFNVSAWCLDSASGIRVNDLVVLLLDGEYHFTLIKGVNETSVLLADISGNLAVCSCSAAKRMFTPGEMLPPRYSPLLSMKSYVMAVPMSIIRVSLWVWL